MNQYGYWSWLNWVAKLYFFIGSWGEKGSGGNGKGRGDSGGGGGGEGGKT